MDIQSVILTILNKKEAKEEFDKLHEWKSETEENLKLYSEIMQINEASLHMSDYKDFDAHKAYDRFAAERSSEHILGKSLIALLLLAILGFFVFNKLNNSSPVTPDTPVIQVAENAVKNVELEDHSLIDLNKGSSVEVMLATDERKVRLEGEAYFKVASDKDRPFIISLGDQGGTIKVLGTSFNVKHYEDVLDIYVYEGLVAYQDGDKIIHLRQGDRLSKVDGAIVKYRKFDPALSSWRISNMTFENVELQEVLTQIGAHFNIPIKISKEVSNSGCSIRSKYTAETIEGILSELSKIAGLEYAIQEGTYYFKAANCE